MTPIVAIANLKGGVGKSTTTVMLAEGLAYFFGLRVLVFDLDAQASSTQMLLTERGADTSFESAHGSAHILQRFGSGVRVRLDEMVSQNSTIIKELQEDFQSGGRRGWVSLVPAHPKMREIELDLEEKWYGAGKSPSNLTKSLTSFLGEAVQTVQAQYDVVLLDCPPHLSAISRSGLALADYFVVPTLADVVSFWGLKQFHRYGVSHIEKEMEARRFIVVTRWTETTHSKDMFERLTADLGHSRLGARIPQTVKIQEAMERPHHNSLLRFNAKYKGNAGSSVKSLAEAFARFINEKESVSWQKVR